MDLMTILSIIGSILGGAGITQFFNWRAQKRKADLENNSIQTQNDSAERQSYLESMKSMQDTILSQENRNRELFNENKSCHNELYEIKSDLAQCSTAMCKWGLCPLREPEKGLGDEHLDSCKKKNATLFDNTEFEDFARLKGYKFERLKKVDYKIDNEDDGEIN